MNFVGKVPDFKMNSTAYLLQRNFAFQRPINALVYLFRETGPVTINFQQFCQQKYEAEGRRDIEGKYTGT